MINKDQIKKEVNELFEDGKTPCEQFDMSWEQLQELSEYLEENLVSNCSD